jgi:hypothetical protein
MTQEEKVRERGGKQNMRHDRFLFLSLTTTILMVDDKAHASLERNSI